MKMEWRLYLSGSVPVLPVLLEPEPPVPLVPLEEPLVPDSTVVVPSALMVVLVPFSATMMMTVLSPVEALRVMVAGHAPARKTSA